MIRGVLKAFASLAIIGSLVAAVSGCAISLGGGDEEIVRKETMGKQLLDLKEAKDRGALTDEEYQREKERIIHSNR